MRAVNDRRRDSEGVCIDFLGTSKLPSSAPLRRKRSISMADCKGTNNYYQNTFQALFSRTVKGIFVISLCIVIYCYGLPPNGRRGKGLEERTV
jgi:hypothetical protein